MLVPNGTLFVGKQPHQPPHSPTLHGGTNGRPARPLIHPSHEGTAMPPFVIPLAMIAIDAAKLVIEQNKT